MVEKDWGHLGQRCKACGIQLEVVQTLSKAGEPQFGLACKTHGRFSDWYLDAEDARWGKVYGLRPRSAPPLPKGTRPPPREPIVMEQVPDTGAEVVRAELERVEARERRIRGNQA